MYQTEKIPLRQTMSAVAVLTVVILILRFQAVRALSSTWLGGSSGDAGLYIYLFRHHLRHLFTEPFFSLEAFYPYPQPLAWSDNFILPALLAMPFFHMGVSEVVLYNGVLLLAHLAFGYAVFRLVMLMMGEYSAALFSGVVAVALGYLAHSLGHPQLQFVFFLPLGIEVLLRSPKHPLIMGLVFGALLLSCFLTTVYFAIFLAMLPFLCLLTLFFLFPARHAFHLMGRFSVGYLPFCLLIIPFLLPYLETRELFGPRLMKEMHLFRATGLSYVSAVPLSWLYGETREWTHEEAHFFPGFLLYALSLLGVYCFAHAKRLFGATTALLGSIIAVFVFDGIGEEVASRYCMYGAFILGVFVLKQQRKGREQRADFNPLTPYDLGVPLFLALIAFFGFLSLGPVNAEGTFSLGLFELGYELIPGMNSLRAIARAGILVIIGVLVLAGCGVAVIIKRVPTQKATLVVTTMLMIIGVTENLVTNYAVVKRLEAPTVLRVLVDAPTYLSQEPVIAFLPLAEVKEGRASEESRREFAVQNVNAVNWALDAGLKTINGYSGQQTRIMKELPRQTARFPDANSLHALATISNVRYILFRSAGEGLLSLLRELRSLGEESGLELLAYERRDGGMQEALLFFSGRTRLKSGESIRVSSAQTALGKRFQLEVKLFSAGGEQGSSEQIILQEVDHGMDELGKKSFTVPRDNNWHTLELTLPPVNREGLPFRIEVIAESGEEVLIEGARVVSE